MASQLHSVLEIHMQIVAAQRTGHLKNLSPSLTYTIFLPLKAEFWSHTNTPGREFCPQIGMAVTSPNSAIKIVHQLSDPLQNLKLTLAAFNCTLCCEIW